MNIRKYITIILFIPFTIFSQSKHLKGFDNLVNKTWIAEGKWSNETLFKQEIKYSYGLNNSIIITDSKGFIDPEQTKYGDRNHGIRQYNASKKVIDFWEFDTFGGITTGTVEIKGKNILYSYKYGESTITDLWEYIDDTTYKYTVGNYKNGNWEAIYLQTKFRLKNE